MHLIGGPSAPRAAAPRGWLAAAEASTAESASRLPAAALGALITPNQPSREGCVGRIRRRPGHHALKPPARHLGIGAAAVALPDDVNQVVGDVAIRRLGEVDRVPLLPDRHPT